MWHGRRLLTVIAALAVAGCARQPAYTGDPSPAAAYEANIAASAAPPPVAYVPTPPQRPASYQLAHAAPPGSEPGPRVLPEQPYTLDSGDRLRVVVFGQEGLTNSYAVATNGAITMPLIGAVPARGLTTQQLGSAVAARLRHGYIREPHVAVEIETYRPFFILGEVTYPGQYPYVANMTVETAVAIAGGFSPRAKRSAVDLTRPHGPQSARATVPLYTPVRPGDTITVAERWF